jgi:hypothetical protein
MNWFEKRKVYLILKRKFNANRRTQWLEKVNKAVDVLEKSIN